MVTDPATDLANICQSFDNSYTGSMADLLAGIFDVPPFSEQQFRILFHLRGMCDDLVILIDHFDIDQESIQTSKRVVIGVKEALDPRNLLSPWIHANQDRIGWNNTTLIRLLSGYAKNIVSYPILTEDEIKELLSIIDEFLHELDNFELDDFDFVRDSCRHYLSDQKFILERFHLFGWKYGVHSLKELLYLYFFFESKASKDEENPKYKAFLIKLKSLSERIVKAYKVAKSFDEACNLIVSTKDRFKSLENAGEVMGLLENLSKATP